MHNIEPNEIYDAFMRYLLSQKLNWSYQSVNFAASYNKKKHLYKPRKMSKNEKGSL